MRFISKNKQAILAIVPKVLENHANMKIIIKKTRINELDDFLLVADLKLLNIILGIGVHSSKYPCPYGHCYKAKDGTWIVGIRKTLQNILKNFLR